LTRKKRSLVPKPNIKSTDRVREFRNRRSGKKEEENRDWREIWEKVKREMELESRGNGRITKELYYIIGKVLNRYKEGRKELSRHRYRTAMKIYLTYKNSDEVDDGVGIRDILYGTRRLNWESKILGGRSCYGKPIC
jgi:hypothetical protein